MAFHGISHLPDVVLHAFSMLLALKISENVLFLHRIWLGRREQALMLAATGAVHNSCENFGEAQKVLEEERRFRMALKKGNLRRRP